LIEDFRHAFSNYDLKGLDLEDALGELSNPAPLPFVKDVSFYFTGQELSRLYKENPTWAKLEERLYGNLFCLS
jgi:hypothetical protein